MSYKAELERYLCSKKKKGKFGKKGEAGIIKKQKLAL